MYPYKVFINLVEFSIGVKERESIDEQNQLNLSNACYFTSQCH